MTNREGTTPETTHRPRSLPGPIGTAVSWFVEAPLALHVFAVALALVALTPFMRPTATWTSDEGAVRFQVELLAMEGSWSAPRPFADIDPEGITSPIHAATVVGERYSPYTKQPAWPLLLAPVRRAFGEWQIVLPALVASVVAATFGALIAGVIAVRIRNVTLWLLAFATSLSFYAFTVLAHPVATALGAIALYAVVRARDRASFGWVVACVAVFAASFVRAEAVAFGIAMGIAVAVAQPGVRWRVKGILGTSLVLSALLAAVLNRVWAVSVGGAAPVAEAQGILDGFRFVSGVFSSLVLVDFGTPALLAVVLSMLAGAVLLALSIEREPDNAALHRVLAGVGLAGSVALVVIAPEPVGGVLAASPFLLVGLVLLRRRHLDDVTIRLVLVTSALFALAVFATQDSGGGGAQWGGRYLMLALPGLVPVAVVGVRSLLASRPASRTILLLPLVVASLALMIDATLVLQTGRDNSIALTTDLEELAAAVGDDAGRPIIVSSRTHIGRHAWRTIPSTDYLLVPYERFDEYVERLVNSGVDRFGVAGGWSPGRVELFTSLGFRPLDPDEEPFLVMVRDEG